MHSDYDQLYYVCMSPSTQKIRLEALFLGCLPICTYMHAYPNEGILLPSCCQHPVILYFRNASNEVHKNARQSSRVFLCFKMLCSLQLSGQPLSKYGSWIGGVAKPCSKNVFLVSIVVITVWIDLVDQCIKVWIRSQRTLRHKFLATCWTLFIPTPKCSDNTFLAKPVKIMLTIQPQTNDKSDSQKQSH